MPVNNRLPIVLAELGYKHGDKKVLAGRWGVSTATVSNILNKVNYLPELETALRIAKDLGKRVEEIWVLVEE